MNLQEKTLKSHKSREHRVLVEMIEWMTTAIQKHFSENPSHLTPKGQENVQAWFEFLPTQRDLIRPAYYALRKAIIFTSVDKTIVSRVIILTCNQIAEEYNQNLNQNLPDIYQYLYTQPKFPSIIDPQEDKLHEKI